MNDIKKLVFSTHNKNKHAELQAILPDYKILNLYDLGCDTEIQESGTTLEENAFIKAEFVYKKYAIDCIADDTGLEVDFLNGAPGVHSARYAGDSCDAKANVQKLLYNMQDADNRTARFKTVIVLFLDGKPYYFNGIIEGTITREPRGNNGFGYDPVFMPKGYDKTFAQMEAKEKNTISHRALAVKQLVEFLQKV